MNATLKVCSRFVLGDGSNKEADRDNIGSGVGPWVGGESSSGFTKGVFNLLVGADFSEGLRRVDLEKEQVGVRARESGIGSLVVNRKALVKR